MVPQTSQPACTLITTSVTSSRCGWSFANTVTSSRMRSMICSGVSHLQERNRPSSLTCPQSNNLTKISGLKVAARSSAFQFKGRNEDLRSVGQKLGVANVLEGSVRKEGNRV